MSKESRKNDPEADLKGLLARYAREMVVMGYHYILRTLLGYVSLALPILGRNVTHWIDDLGWAGSREPGSEELFGV